MTANGNGNNGTLTRILIGLLGMLSASGIMGSVVMYGQVQALAAQVLDDHRQLDEHERRLRNCERTEKGVHRL